ncbi:MAG: dipicolinate synthase subunit B [Clostridia bacterium]|nr:dipicolinate synthase subunit B [Clostridia bacterium]
MSINVGYAICGSFCTHKETLEQMENLVHDGYNIIPILSYNSSTTDTRFGTAKSLKEKIAKITPNPIIDTIVDAEPIGPKKMCDLLVIAPCTGNTLAKLCNGITDTPVTMAAKSHLRIGRPVLIALCTNDALGASAQNFGRLINTKNIFFVPLYQDAPDKKPNSLVARFNLMEQSVPMALSHQQLQPVLI